MNTKSKQHLFMLYKCTGYDAPTPNTFYSVVVVKKKN